MPIRIRRFPLHRRGRELSAGRVLYVTRRIPTGRDADGVATCRVPGEVFDPTGIPEPRLKALFRGQFIGHDLPAHLARKAAAAPAPSPVTAPVPKQQPTPKRTRANAPGA